MMVSAIGEEVPRSDVLLFLKVFIAVFLTDMIKRYGLYDLPSSLLKLKFWKTLVL